MVGWKHLENIHVVIAYFGRALHSCSVISPHLTLACETFSGHVQNYQPGLY